MEKFNKIREENEALAKKTEETKQWVYSLSEFENSWTLLLIAAKELT